MGRLASILTLCSVLTITTSAQAGWAEFWHRVHVDWHRMNCWPEPFQHADRQVTIAPLISMTDAGWRLQNTLSDHFFNPEDQTLTRAGQMKTRWIATQAPLHRRTVFVLRSPNARATMTRVESVRRYLEQMIPDSTRPEVVLTDKVPAGGSGAYFDEVDRQLKSSVPAPRLPEMQDTTGGS
jgi:hypothetical protein